MQKLVHDPLDDFYSETTEKVKQRTYEFLLEQVGDLIPALLILMV